MIDSIKKGAKVGGIVGLALGTIGISIEALTSDPEVVKSLEYALIATKDILTLTVGGAAIGAIINSQIYNRRRMRRYLNPDQKMHDY